MESEYQRWSDEFEDARMMYRFYWSVRSSYGECPEWGNLDFSECLCWMNVAALARSHLNLNNADPDTHVSP